MVGNDVVDLRDAETRSQHPRFDARVFDKAERERIADAHDPHRMRWILWAAKEAAYKLARRQDATTIFAPRSFRVALDPDLPGRVRLGRRCFSLNLSCGDEFVHAVATPEGCAPPEFGVADVADLVGSIVADPARTPGRAARALALDELANVLGAPREDLAIEREGRIPWLCRGGKRINAALSLSHHGRFAAYACLPLGVEAP